MIRRSSPEPDDPRSPAVVLKFGGSVLAGEADLPTAADEIRRWVRRGHRVVAVASAIGDETDRLIAKGRRLCDAGDPHTLAELLATGERRAAALLGLALDRAGVRAAVVDPSRIALRTDGFALDAEPRGLDVDSLEEVLRRFDVAVVPGFIGVDGESGATTLLGRGGSDLTAVFIAAELGCERCLLLKDVEGVYTEDPKQSGGDASRFATVSYEDALEVAGEVVQAKAIEYARDRGVVVTVTSIGARSSTTIGPGPSELAAAADTAIEGVRSILRPATRSVRSDDA